MEGIVGYEQEKKEKEAERESQGQDTNPHKFHTLLEWIF